MTIEKSSSSTNDDNLTIVRVIGHGQFKVNGATLNKINQIDNEIVNMLNDKQEDNKVVDEKEFRKKITEIVNLITTEGKPIEDRELVGSDIIVPGADLSIEEAKDIFKGEGVIPEI
jgi:hypothetical protein